MQTLNAQRLQALSPQLRRAARFVLDHPDEVATRSLRHIAQQSGLPPPTFSRLARAIGYETYDDLREDCRRDIRRRKSLLADRALRLVSEHDDKTPFLVSHAAAAVRNTQALLEGIDHAEMERAAKRLAGAGRVVLIGNMSGRALMDYAGYVAALSLPNWAVVGRGAASLGADLANLAQGDAALVLSFQPYAARSVEAARAVRSRGAFLVVVTDTPLSPLAGLADALFLMPTDSPQFFPCHVGALVFLEALIGMVVRTKGAVAQRRIAAVEGQSYALCEYWQEEPAATTGRRR